MCSSSGEKFKKSLLQEILENHYREIGFLSLKNFSYKKIQEKDFQGEFDVICRVVSELYDLIELNIEIENWPDTKNRSDMRKKRERFSKSTLKNTATGLGLFFDGDLEKIIDSSNEESSVFRIVFNSKGDYKLLSEFDSSKVDYSINKLKKDGKNKYSKMISGLSKLNSKEFDHKIEKKLLISTLSYLVFNNTDIVDFKIFKINGGYFSQVRYNGVKNDYEILEPVYENGFFVRDIINKNGYKAGGILTALILLQDYLTMRPDQFTEFKNNNLRNGFSHFRMVDIYDDLIVDDKVSVSDAVLFRDVNSNNYRTKLSDIRK